MAPETSVDTTAPEPSAPQEDRDTQRAQENILRVQIREGLSELNRPTAGLFLASLSAGLDIGFGPLLMAVSLTVAEFSFASPLVRRLLTANAYALGFIFVIFARSELFTEHTTLAVLPVLDGQASVRQLGRLWGLVYLGNIVGATVFAAIAVLVMPALGVVKSRAFVEIATTLTEHGWPVLVAAGVLAGWLMGLLSWLVAAGQDSVSRLLFVWLVATAIGFAHLPHSIAGTVEVLLGLFSSAEVTVGGFARFLVASTVGNVIGGSIFVSLLKYSYVAQSGPDVG
jgi:formate/nitrite transporter FocA (FNT family)